jgi:pimeloyl-ACP methyl ester carboxylesterase
VGPDGRLRFWSFLSRLAEQPFITAALDMPSDHAGGIAGTDPFITSEPYMMDIKTVIDFLRRKWSQPLFLVGHSGGTTSVGHFGAVLKDHRIGGLVLLAAISWHPRGGVSLANLPLHEIEYPVLFVHHRDDRCVDFAGARQQAYRLSKSPKVTFIEVMGGDPSRAHECSPFAARRGTANYGHFFAGKEQEVFQAVADWIMGKPVPERIGP